MFIALLLLWLIFSGGVTWTGLALGVPVSALITAFAARYMGYSHKKFSAGLRQSGELAKYILYLLKEIVAANFAVMKIIYRREPPKAGLVRFTSALKTDGARVLAANSITLTPGTYTVELRDGEYVVHSLDRAFDKGIESCGFFERAQRLEEC